MNGAERRCMWADRIERCLASDMPIREWCRLNHVGESSLYKWMARFRKDDPGRFPRRSSIATNWIEVARGSIADSKAIVPTDASQAPCLAAMGAYNGVGAGNGSDERDLALPASCGCQAVFSLWGCGRKPGLGMSQEIGGVNLSWTHF